MRVRAYMRGTRPDGVGTWIGDLSLSPSGTFHGKVLLVIAKPAEGFHYLPSFRSAFAFIHSQ